MSGLLLLLHVALHNLDRPHKTHILTKHGEEINTSTTNTAEVDEAPIRKTRPRVDHLPHQRCLYGDTQRPIGDDNGSTDSFRWSDWSDKPIRSLPSVDRSVKVDQVLQKVNPLSTRWWATATERKKRGAESTLKVLWMMIHPEGGDGRGTEWRKRRRGEEKSTRRKVYNSRSGVARSPCVPPDPDLRGCLPGSLSLSLSIGERRKKCASERQQVE